MITTGIPGTAMPATRLGLAEAKALVAYLRSMRDFNAPAVMVGDAARGQRAVRWKGRLHQLATARMLTGSRVAPDLSDIGATRGADALWRSLLDPTSAMRPINRPVHIVTEERQDDQRPAAERGHVLRADHRRSRAAGVADEERCARIHGAEDLRMPSYKDKLTQQEIADIVSYLVSLKGGI